MEISYPERVSRLNKHIGQGTLIRNRYRGTDAKGRETACLLAALSPEVASGEDAYFCPADVMPKWLAYLTPTIDDAGSQEVWMGTVRRYAKLAADWHMLSKSQWDRLAVKAFLFAVGECKDFVPLDQWDAVNERLEGELSGNIMSDAGRQALLGEISAKMGRSKTSGDQNARRVLVRGLASRSGIRGGTGVEGIWKTACQAGDRYTPLANAPAARASIDRMTNLLFDAIEKEIDIAKEALT